MDCSILGVRSKGGRLTALCFTVAIAALMGLILIEVSAAQPIPGRLDVMQNLGPQAPKVQPAVPQPSPPPTPPPPSRAGVDTQKILDSIDALRKDITGGQEAVKPGADVHDSKRPRFKGTPPEKIPGPEIEKLSGIIGELKGQVELLRQAVERLNKNLVNSKTPPNKQ